MQELIYQAISVVLQKNPLLSLEVFVILWSTALKKYLPDTVSHNKFHMLQLLLKIILRCMYYEQIYSDALLYRKYKILYIYPSCTGSNCTLFQHGSGKKGVISWTGCQSIPGAMLKVRQSLSNN